MRLLTYALLASALATNGEARLLHGGFGTAAAAGAGVASLQGIGRSLLDVVEGVVDTVGCTVGGATGAVGEVISDVTGAPPPACQKIITALNGASGDLTTARDELAQVGSGSSYDEISTAVPNAITAIRAVVSTLSTSLGDDFGTEPKCDLDVAIAFRDASSVIQSFAKTAKDKARSISKGANEKYDDEFTKQMRNAVMELTMIIKVYSSRIIESVPSDEAALRNNAMYHERTLEAADRQLKANIGVFTDA